MTRIITFLTIFLSVSFMSEATSRRNAPAPDFAYPETVSTNASASLSRALASGNEEGALRAVIDLALAGNEISSDRMPAILQRIDSITQTLKSPDIQSLFYLLQARIYTDIYDSERYAIQNRPPSSGEGSDDYKLWGPAQFSRHIIELCNAAMAEERALLRRRLADYKSVVTANSLTLTFYPRLYDFVASEVIRMLRNLDTPKSIALANEFMQQRTEYSRGVIPAYIECRISEITDNRQLTPGVRFERLGELLSSLEKTPYQIEVALAMADLTEGDKEREKRLYPILDSMVKAYPSYPRFNCLVNAVTQISMPHVRVSVPVTASPDLDLKFNVTSTNVKEATVTFYRIPDSSEPGENYFRPSQLSTLKAVATCNLKFQGSVPFEVSDTGSVRLPAVGNYIAVAKAPGVDAAPRQSYRIIQCSRLSTSLLTFDKTSALVVEPVTGAPVKDAEIMWLPPKKVSRFVGETDSHGMAEIGLDSEARLKAVKDQDTYSPTVWFYPERSHREGKTTDIKGFTSLPVYRPGDSIQWTFMAYELEGKNYWPLRDTEMKVTLLDANRQKADSMTVKTDSYGRIQGSFVLPAAGLTGNFCLLAETGETSRSLYFMVSEYKMPSFRVEITDIATGVPEKGAVTIQGNAITYSGMPVGSASVDIKIEKSMMWWRGNAMPFEPVKMQTETDADGKWKIVIPASAMTQTGDNGTFTASVSVTSPSGEMQSSQRGFAIGSPLRIVATLPRAIDVTDSLTLDLKVVDARDSVVKANVNYAVMDGGKTVAAGVLMTPDSTVTDWRSIPTGMYTVRFTVAEDTLSLDNVAFYRPDDKISPSGSTLWTPMNELMLGPDSEADILIGTLPGKTHVLLTLWDGDGVYRQGWIELEGGIHPIRVKGPHGASNLTATFIATRDMESERIDVSLKTPLNPRAIRMKVSAMRDKLLPGTEERWTISVVNSQDVPVEAAVMTEMYNKALDAIMPSQQWRLNIMPPYSRFLSWRAPDSGNSISTLYKSVNMLSCAQIEAPVFELYGLGFGMQTFRRYSSRAGIAVRGVSEQKLMMRAAPTAGNGMMMKADAIAEDSAVMTEAEEAVADEGGADMSVENEPADYRDASVTLAFFRPMLTTDHQGNLTLEFTVPQANATWAFRTLAYTADMRTTQHDAVVVSQKPVMVKPNPPRFLRQGDKVNVITAVMNATDSVLTRVKVELGCRDIDGTVVASDVSEVTVGPKATAYVSLSVGASESAGLIFTAKATASDFSDGERVLIPVLEATTPVIESRPFYMAPDDKTARISLPAAPESVTTVEFCANPQWYVVTALPGLRRGDMLTAPQAADAIFSCAVAEGIIRNNPSIAEALREWTSGNRDEVALTSLLERNEDMKALLLDSTPWMMDARSQTERMERLALLFDRKATEGVYASATELLKKLERQGGGWSWIAQSSEASQWATQRVLSVLGPLNRLGFFPENKELRRMVGNAIGYVDRQAAEMAARHPDADMTSYTILRDMYPEVKLPSECRRIVAATVQKTLGSWKAMPLSDKPQAAMMLYRHNYQSVANEILESMRQFTESSPEKGVWFPSIENNSIGYLSLTAEALDAFSLIDRNSPQVEGLRQWLVMQKQATEWGDSPAASLLIASILTSGGNYKADAAGTISVTVNGRDLRIEPTDSRLGYLRSEIETGNLPAEVVFSRSGDVASWGSVMRRSRQLITEVEAAGVEDLSIEKRLILPEGATTVKTGDRLTVELTIRVGRNMNYVTITDNRAACMEPADQIPHTRLSDGVVFYMEPRDASTNIFVTTMPKGTYILTYDVTANNAGSFASGIANVQCQQAAELTAHSSGSVITVER